MDDYLGRKWSSVWSVTLGLCYNKEDGLFSTESCLQLYHLDAITGLLKDLKRLVNSCWITKHCNQRIDSWINVYEEEFDFAYIQTKWLWLNFSNYLDSNLFLGVYLTFLHFYLFGNTELILKGY